MPIFNGLDRLFFRFINGNKLRKWNRQAVSLPPHHDEHLAFTFFPRSHPDDLHLVIDMKG